MDNIQKRILTVPQNTPNEALWFTTNNTTTTKWAEETKKAKQERGIEKWDMKGEK